jgi:NAD(P)-dependent dehydrogenase (short-subunit alcohol dehydrogenase family)
VLEKFRLNGKIAVVTGASKNIGLEISRSLTEVGATVVMVARNAELLELRAEGLRAENGGSVHTCAGDVGRRADVERITGFVADLFGRVDILVNNARANGDTTAVPPLEIPDEPWHETFAVNVLGPYQLIAGLGPLMKAAGGGSVVNILSGSGFLPMPGLMCYGVTKAALWSMTKYLATELGPDIRVNAVCPGLTMSDTGGPAPDDENAILAASLTSLKRGSHPSEVAPAVVYLASDASSYTTGAVIVVNGGRPWA